LRIFSLLLLFLSPLPLLLLHSPLFSSSSSHSIPHFLSLCSSPLILPVLFSSSSSSSPPRPLLFLLLLCLSDHLSLQCCHQLFSKPGANLWPSYCQSFDF